MSDGISGLLMVSAKGFSRGKLGEEEEAWKVGTETNVTRWQLNAVLPSKGCMFFARTGRGGQRTGKISSQRFVNLSVVFFFVLFFSSHLWLISLCPPISLRGQARGSEGGGKERGKGLQKRGIFHSNRFRPCNDFCSVLQSCLPHFAEKS